ARVRRRAGRPGRTHRSRRAPAAAARARACPRAASRALARAPRALAVAGARAATPRPRTPRPCPWLHRATRGGLPAYAEARLAVVALQGKRIFITGGAGFIATTLGRRLVEQNEIVALDNLHRDALSATDLADHPNFTLHQADVLD